jgi:hypothetical protein
MAVDMLGLRRITMSDPTRLARARVRLLRYTGRGREASTWSTLPLLTHRRHSHLVGCVSLTLNPSYGLPPLNYCLSYTRM